MAFFSDLVRAVAQAEGMDEMTVTGIGQYLRDKGMITKGGRGLSAARMGPRDAANLLIAVNATSTAKKAVETVEIFSHLPIAGKVKITPRAPRYKGKDFEHFSAEIERVSTFGDLIESVITLSTPRPDDLSVIDAVFPPAITNTWLDFSRPFPVGSFRIEKFGAIQPFINGRPEIYAHLRFCHVKHAEGKSGQNRPDKFELTSIGRPTLSSIGQILAE